MLSGVVCESLEREDVAAARAELDALAQIFGADGVFVEVQHAGMASQAAINAHLRGLAADAGLPMVATCDAHYPCREDADAHEALLAIQTRDLLSNPSRFRFDTKEFFLKTGAEMAAALPTSSTRSRCRSRSPSAARPCGCRSGRQAAALPGPGGESADAYLERLCREGLAARYPDGPPPAPRSALRFELGVIGEMGFASYFLIVWDYMRWARENGVAVGPGRGRRLGRSWPTRCASSTSTRSRTACSSSASSTRAAGPCRTSTPTSRWPGATAWSSTSPRSTASSAVARIGTFGKLLARAVVRDAGRVLGHSYGQVDRIAKLVPERPIGIRFDDAMKPGTELAQAYAEDPVAKEIIDTARRWRACATRASTPRGSSSRPATSPTTCPSGWTTRATW